MAKFIESLGQQVGDAGAQGIVGMGMNLLDEMLMGNRRRKKQLEQQQKLTDMQVGANKELMDLGYQQQMDMWHNTNYSAQMKEMEKAGLNPAMIYGMGGAGGETGAGAVGSAGAGQSDSEATQKMADMQMTGMGLQMQKQRAEIRAIEADARKKEAETKTVESTRDLIAENMRMEGAEKWMENLKTNWLMRKNPTGELERTDDFSLELYGNKVYDMTASINPMGGFNREASLALAKTEAEKGNVEAQAVLTNEKAKGYWQELLNATAHADADKAKAAAVKLATEWQTGEYTNWKTWVNTATDAINGLSNVIKMW